MATSSPSAVLVRTPEGFFQRGGNGLVPITDPVQLRDLNAGNTPYMDAMTSNNAAYVPSPTVTQSSLPQAPVTPLPSPIPQPIASAGGATMTGSDTPPPGSNPYTIFNQNMASLLKQIQQAQISGSTQLGNNIAQATNVGVSPNGATPFDPNVSSAVQVAGRQGLSDAFQPVIAGMNQRMQNANASMSLLSGNIKDMAAPYAPQTLSPGQSLVTPGGQVLINGTTYSVNPDPLNPGKFIMTPQNSVTSSGGGNSIGESGAPIAPGGIDWSAYNGGVDQDYRNKMTTATSTLRSTMPQGFDPTIADVTLKAHKSPITSQMISLAASTYGVDPTDLMANVGLESIYGTSKVAADDNNPGGIQWANQPHAVQGTPRPPSEGGYYAKFDNMQDGLYAQAKLISQLPKGTGAVPTAPAAPSPIAVMVQSDAQSLASGLTAPQVLQDKYNKAGTPALYLQAVALAKQINPSFNETQANLKYQGEQTKTENMNSGNPITNLFSNFTNALTTPQSIFSPVKAQSGTTSSGMGYTILP